MTLDRDYLGRVRQSCIYWLIADLASKLETMLHPHDIEAWRAALATVQQFGPHALRRALTQIDELRKVGDVIGATTWAIIADAIIELSRHRRDDEPLN